MEDFVTYEQAISLKRVGFDWPTTRFYTKANIPNGDILLTGIGTMIELTDEIDGEPPFLSVLRPAPTLTQAAKWLREKWNMHIDACVFGDCSEDADGKIADQWTFWAFSIYSTESGKQIVDDNNEYDTYEAALSAGITKVLNIINGISK